MRSWQAFHRRRYERITDRRARRSHTHSALRPGAMSCCSRARATRPTRCSARRRCPSTSAALSKSCAVDRQREAHRDALDRCGPHGRSARARRRAANPSSTPASATDTRTLVEGSLFVALRGETHDAHAFLDQAASAGARAAVVDHVPANGAPRTLLYAVVRDTLEALGLLGRFHRRRTAVRSSASRVRTAKRRRRTWCAAFSRRAFASTRRPATGITCSVCRSRSGVRRTDTEVIVAEIGTNRTRRGCPAAGIAEPDAVVIDDGFRRASRGTR